MPNYKRVLVLLILVLAAPLAARANQSATGWCETGGQAALVSGLTSSNLFQGSFPQCTVSVFIHGTGALAPLFSDNLATPTPLGNPFTTTSAIGQWTFYAANGRYDVTISGAGLPSPVSYSDIILFDCTVAAACVSTGGSTVLVNSAPITSPNFTNSANVQFSVTGGSLVSAVLVGVPLLAQPNLFTSTNNFSQNPTFGGLPALSVTGTPTPGDCPIFATTISVTDGGVCSAAALLASNNLFTGFNQFVNTCSSIRPSVNVMCYGAKGDGVTDDTAAIQAAINVACNNNAATVFFPPPPNFYKVMQTQLGVSPTAAVFTPPVGTPCYPGFGFFDNIAFVGANSSNSRPQFSSKSVAVTVTPGPSPNAGPVFPLSTASSIEGIAVNGYNIGIYVAGSNTKVIHSPASIVAGLSLGQPAYPNAPLILSGLELDVEGGTYNANSTVTPAIILLNQGNIGCQPPGDIYVHNFTAVGHIEARNIAAPSCGSAGNWHFYDGVIEDATGGVLAIDDDGNAWGLIAAINIDNVNVSDATYTSYLKINSGPSTLVKGITITHPTILLGGNPVVVQKCAGILQSVFVNGFIGSTGIIEDCSGNVIGNGVAENLTGFDYFADAGTGTDSQRTDLGGIGGGALRVFPAGSQLGSTFATLSVSGLGYCFGSQTYGPDECLKSNSFGSFDITFPTVYAPTSVMPSATTGGTLSAGNYSYFISSTTAGNCNSIATQSAPSLLSASIAVAAPNNAVSLSWALPPAGTSSVSGFCVYRNQGVPFWNSNAQYFFIFVAGGSTTTFTDTGSGFSCCNLHAPVTGSMSGVHRFTATSLGISTLAPAFNLDVNGTARIVGALTGSTESLSGQFTSTLATGTAPLVIASTTPVLNLTAANHPRTESCGTLAVCAPTLPANSLIVWGTVALVSGTPSTATVTALSPAFTSSSSYTCIAEDVTTRTNQVNVANVSGSSFTITGPNTVTDVVSYSCTGN